MKVKELVEWLMEQDQEAEVQGFDYFGRAISVDVNDFQLRSGVVELPYIDRGEEPT